MIYITYNAETGKVDEIAFSLLEMIPQGKPYLEISEEDWNKAQGKQMKVVDGEFIYYSPIQDYFEILYSEKCKKAYNGITVIKDTINYLFETDKDSITMCTAQLQILSTKENDYEFGWKVYVNNLPTFLTITKLEFMEIVNFAMNMINQAFVVEGQFNDEYSAMSDEDIAQLDIDVEKQKIQNEFSKIQTTIEINS